MMNFFYSTLFLLNAISTAHSTLPATLPATLPTILPGSKGVDVPADKGYFYQAIKDQIYWVTDGFYNTIFITTGKGVIVVDAPPSLGEKILKAIGEVTKEPITHVIYSHSHADHIGSASQYPKEAIYISHTKTKERIETAQKRDRPFPFGVFVGGKPVPLPTLTFENKTTLKVGNQILQLEYKGEDHEPGNIYIYAPKQKVLLKVDIVFPGWAPFENLAIAENANGFIQSMNDILSYDFKTLVSGHWSRLANRKDVETQRDYFKAIQGSAAKALQDVNFYEVAKTTGVDNYALLFNTYLAKVTEKCAKPIVEQWESVLAGVDILTSSHCYQIIMALRVN